LLTTDSIRSAFSSRIEPVREPGVYILAVAGVAVAMILLPLLYTALVALTGWGWYYYVTSVLSEFDIGRRADFDSVSH
jgi:MFS family permease